MQVTSKFRVTRWVNAARKAALLGVFIGALGTAVSAQAVTVAHWTFETSQPTTAGPYAPEVGSGAATGSHAGAAVYSTPAGNGSSHSFSSNTFVPGDYYQFQVSTTGLDGISLGWDQTSSNTGPRDWQLEYSLNGTSFTNIGAVYQVLANNTPNPLWNATTSSPIYTFSLDLSSITALNNAATVDFRLADTDTISANGGAVGTAGTDRVDNVIVAGSTILTPEPGSVVLAAIGLASLALTAIRRHRRQ